MPIPHAPVRVHVANFMDVRDQEAACQLFDAYRQFYGQTSNLTGVKAFLQARAERHESIVLLARHETDDQALGLVQLYPSFSSVSMAPITILNDLYVAPAGRRCGVAKALLRASHAQALTLGAVRLTLSTHVTNHAAQAVYEAMGWQRDSAFVTYQRPLNGPLE